MYFYLFLALTSLNAQETILPKNSPISVLSLIKTANIEHSNEMAIFDPRWVDSLSLSLPCYDVPVPKRTMRLPNAPRNYSCLLYTSPSPRDRQKSRMPSSA